MEKKYCRCGEQIEEERYNLGHFICTDCGEERAKRKLYTVVPLNKGSYIVLTNKEELKTLNPKTSLYKG